jgi:hypothetical protein
MFGELKQELPVCLDLAATNRRRQHHELVDRPAGQLPGSAQRAGESSPALRRAELPETEAQLVALHRVRAARKLTIEPWYARPGD